MDTSIKSLYNNVAEWLAGPVGSVTIHVALILALIFLVTFAKKDSEPPPVEVTVVDPDEIDLDELDIELEPPPIDEMVDVVTPPEVDIDFQPPDIPDFAADNSAMDTMTDLQIASDVSSPLVLKGLQAGDYANRSGAGRASAGGMYGGQWAEAAEAAEAGLPT